MSLRGGLSPEAQHLGQGRQGCLAGASLWSVLWGRAGQPGQWEHLSPGPALGTSWAAGLLETHLWSVPAWGLEPGFLLLLPVLSQNRFVYLTTIY